MRTILVILTAATAAVTGCAANAPVGPGSDAGDTDPRDGGAGSMDSGGGGFDARIPPPEDGGVSMFCGPDSSVDAAPPPDPGDCMDGVAVPGCPCTTVGETRPCRTGRMITCESLGEFGGEWGPCLGSCFSSGTWLIDNLSPCFISYSTGETYAVSTVIAGGSAACPDVPSTPPPPAPAEDWSPNRLTVDCEGAFELCYTLRAGDAESPSDTDCVVARVCTSGWYASANVTQELDPLEGWVGDDPACAADFADNGGYGEMSVRGQTVDCEWIDDDRGDFYVFNRVNYCPTCCNTGECSGAMCDNCMMGGSGSF